MAQPVPQIPLSTAREYAFRGAVIGSDAAPLHGDCSDPVDRELRGVAPLYKQRLAALADPFVDYADGYGWLPGREPRPEPPAVHTVYVRVRCRKCPECLRHKRRLWTARGIQEVRQSSRTWFGTLTVAPEYRFWAKAKAEQKAATSRRESWSTLTPSERTKAIAAQLSPEVTRWLKRVRKASGAKLRYLLVVEAHDDGFPHMHLLLHETTDSRVSKRQLESQWRYGISHWRLIEAGNVGSVGYVCKYITKSAQTRIRASQKYGRPNGGLITERLVTQLAQIRAVLEENAFQKGGDFLRDLSSESPSSTSLEQKF